MKIRKAIEILDEVIPPPHNEMVDMAHAPIANAWELIRKTLFRVQWTSATDKQPADDKPVLVATERGRICVGFYIADLKKWMDYEANKRDEYFSGFPRDNVTHWMTLPDLPTKSEV